MAALAIALAGLGLIAAAMFAFAALAVGGGDPVFDEYRHGGSE